MNIRSNIRAYRSGDEYWINDLYNRVFNRTRTLDQWRWEFLRKPGKPSFIRVLEYNSRPIAHWALLTHDLCIDGMTHLGGKTENAMIEPEFRGKGLFVPFEKEFLKQAYAEGIEVPWSSLSAAAKIHCQGGFRPVGKLVFYFRYVHFRSFIKNFSLSFLSTYLSRVKKKMMLRDFRALSTQNSNRVNFRKMAKFDESIKFLWDKCKTHFGITISRDSDYLNWRFIDNAYHLSEVYYMEDAETGELLGYGVVRVRQKEGLIEDLIVLKRHEALAFHMIKFLVDNLENKGCNLVRFQGIAHDLPLADLLNRCWFIRKRANHDLRNCLQSAPSPLVANKVLTTKK